MISGIVIKGIGGFYYVHAEGKTYECRARGLFRKTGQAPMVGDYVNLSDDGGSLIEILPRKTVMERPPVANVGRVVVVVATQKPKPDLLFVDKLLVALAYSGIEAAICVNKADLDEGGATKALIDTYKGAGVKTVVTSALTGDGMDDLRALLGGGVTAFAGNSGVGKSSLLNRLIDGIKLETGEVSQKTERGRHTTRHVELIPLPGGGYVADTPGFSVLAPKGLTADGLKELFPEFQRLEGECRFRGCTHTKEPGCAVLAAAEKGEIPPSRMESYFKMYEELKLVREWE